MFDLAKPDRTILQALIDANGLKPVAKALLAIATERIPALEFPAITTAEQAQLRARWQNRRFFAEPEPLRPGDPGYLWAFRPGYVGNDDGDICMHRVDGMTRDGWIKSGTVYVPLDAVIEAEAYGWREEKAARGEALTLIVR